MWNFLKRIASAILVIVIAFTLATLLVLGLYKLTPEPISKEAIQLEVKVEDTNYKSMWVQQVPCGKTMTTITHPAEYNTYLLIDGEEYEFSDRDLYDYCEDKVKETIKVEFIKNTYDDNTVDYDFIRIMEE